MSVDDTLFCHFEDGNHFPIHDCFIVVNMLQYDLGIGLQ